MIDREEILRPFEENRAYMQHRIDSGIEANRKGAGQIKVVDRKGDLVSNARIVLRQKTHDFRFGGNLFMLDEMETPEKNEAYKEYFASLFNMATLPFYWNDLEPQEGQPRFSKDSPKIYRRPAPDLCLEFCEQRGIEPKLHCLNYEHNTPGWVPKDVPSVKKLLDKRFVEIGERYADRIPGIEVTNETLNPKTSDCTDFFDAPDLVEWSYHQARKHFPVNKLIINEATDGVWGGEGTVGFRYNRSMYYMMIQRAIANGAPIDAIGMQYHMFYRAEQAAQRTAVHYNPRNLYRTMDLYRDFGLPLQVTEVTIPAYSMCKEDEELQAEILKYLYSIWFSHSNMEAIIYWNLVDGYAAFGPMGDMTYGENYYHGALLRFDMTPKPAYYALNELIHETWNTRCEMDCVKGSASFTGFFGQYDVVVTTPSGTMETTLHLKKNAVNQFTIQMA